MKAVLKKAFAIAFASSFLFACTDDYFEFDEIGTNDWRPELAIPLVKSALSLEDIIITQDSNGIIKEDPNSGVLEVIYDGRVFSTPGADLITLPDQSFEEPFSLPTPLPTTGGTVTQTLNSVIDFDNSGSNAEIDSILLKAGRMILTIENEFEHNVLVDASFPSIKNGNGESLTLNYDIPARTGGSAVVRSNIQDLNGYTIDMTNNGSAFNKIPIQFDMTFNLTSGKSSVPSEALTFKFNMQNLNFKEFNGYVGQTTIPLDQDSINVDIFKNFIDAKFFLSNPLLDINILNSFGLPVDLVFNQLTGFNARATPNTIQVNLPPSARPISLNYPTRYGQDTTLVRLDTNQSNIDSVVSFLVQEIVYNAEANFNPNNDRSIRNFITDTSQLGLDVFLRLPFAGYASGFTMQDTIEFEFENSDQLDNGLVRVRVNNGFPIGGDLQIFFVDNNYNTLEVLFPDGPETIILPAPVDNNGDVINSVFKLTDGEITSDRIKNLTESKFAIIQAKLETGGSSNQEIVAFKKGYQLDITLGLKAKILID